MFWPWAPRWFFRVDNKRGVGANSGLVEFMRRDATRMGDPAAPRRTIERVIEHLTEIFRDIVMRGESGLLEPLDRPALEAETELHRAIEIVGGRQSVIEPRQRRIEIRPHHPVDDASCAI